MRLQLLSFLLRARFCVIAALGFLTMAPFSSAQGLGSSDLSRLRSVSSVALSPDCRRIVYSIILRDRPCPPYSQLCIIDVATPKPAPMGGEKDSNARPPVTPAA